MTVTTGDGVRLHHRLDGDAGRPVLLLANSLGTTLDLWRAQIDLFASEFRVLRFDMRGSGGSDVPRGAYSLDRLGRDVLELLDHLNIDKVSFCGISLGGMIGQWLGIRAPDRLERLVLGNTSPYMGPPAAWDQRIRAVETGGMAAIVDSVVARWFTESFRRSGAGAVAAARAQIETTAPAGYAGCCAAIRDMDLRRSLALIECPTLVIGGTADPATPPEHSHALASGIRGASLRLIEAAHLSNMEQPELFSSLTMAFLR